MSILQTQPILSISTNQCKKHFLTNQIKQMNLRKQIYIDILNQLKGLLKETSVMKDDKTKENCQNGLQKSVKIQQMINDSKINKQSQLTSQQSTNINKKTINPNNEKAVQKKVSQINQKFHQFTFEIQQKINTYCSQQISSNILKYIEIQKQQHYFYPSVINHLKSYIKTHQKSLTQRQKQLQQIEDQKYAIQSDKQNTCNQPQSTKNKTNKKSPTTNKNIDEAATSNNNKKQMSKAALEKKICSFDFNTKLLEVIKKELTLLKLKKRKLENQMNEKKERKIKEEQLMKENVMPQYKSEIQKRSKKCIGLNNQESVNSQANHSKKLPSLKKNILLNHTQAFKQSQAIPYLSFRIKQPSAFQKIVMIYQKDKFLNDVLQQKILQLKKKLTKKKRQNQILIQKTSLLQKQIEKLDWNQVCNVNDQSFVCLKNKKISNKFDLSLLDRTTLRPCDQISAEYEQISINQSIIDSK